MLWRLYMIRFNKARFNHYSKEKLDSISNKYVRVLYAIYVIIKDTIRHIIPNSLKYIYKDNNANNNTKIKMYWPMKFYNITIFLHIKSSFLFV